MNFDLDSSFRPQIVDAANEFTEPFCGFQSVTDHHVIANLELPDGRSAQVQLMITTQEDDFITTGTEDLETIIIE